MALVRPNYCRQGDDCIHAGAMGWHQHMVLMEAHALRAAAGLAESNFNVHEADLGADHDVAIARRPDGAQAVAALDATDAGAGARVPDAAPRAARRQHLWEQRRYMPEILQAQAGRGCSCAEQSKR